jgi:hypothetical protein
MVVEWVLMVRSDVIKNKEMNGESVMPNTVHSTESSLKAPVAILLLQVK